MAIESEYFTGIRRKLAYLEDDIKAMPQGFKEPHRLLHDCIAELTEIVSRLAEADDNQSDDPE